MKKASRIVSLLLTLAVMATMFVVTPVSVSAASLNYKSVVVAVEDDFTVKLRKAKGEVEWSSADEDIATVSNGVITGVSTGKTTVTAKYKSKTYSCKVTVKKYVVDGRKKMTVNETQTMKVKGNTDGKTIKWSSSETDVAAVDSNGKVTAKKAGTVKIYAKIDGKRYAKKISVSKGFSLNASEIKLYEGENYILKVSEIPEGEEIEWRALHSSIATVDSNGYVTAIKHGTTTITAKAGTKIAKCSVKVQPIRPLPYVFEELTYENVMSGIEFGMSMEEVQKIKGMDYLSDDYAAYQTTDVKNGTSLERCWRAYYSLETMNYCPITYVKYDFRSNKLHEVTICDYSLYYTSDAYWDAVNSNECSPIVEDILFNSYYFDYKSSSGPSFHHSYDYMTSTGDWPISGKSFSKEYVHESDSTRHAEYTWFSSKPNDDMPEYHIRCMATITSDKY